MDSIEHVGYWHNLHHRWSNHRPLRSSVVPLCHCLSRRHLRDGNHYFPLPRIRLDEQHRRNHCRPVCCCCPWCRCRHSHQKEHLDHGRSPRAGWRFLRWLSHLRSHLQLQWLVSSLGLLGYFLRRCCHRLRPLLLLRKGYGLAKHFLCWLVPFHALMDPVLPRLLPKRG